MIFYKEEEKYFVPILPTFAPWASFWAEDISFGEKILAKINCISNTKEKVESTSSQKKKEYLYDFLTQDVKTISMRNNSMIPIVMKSNTISDCLLNISTLISSENNA